MNGQLLWLGRNSDEGLGVEWTCCCMSTPWATLSLPEKLMLCTGK